MATARYLQRGLGIKTLGQNVNNFLKRTQAISKAASMFGHPNISSTISSLGYGRRRRGRRAKHPRMGQGLKLAGQGLSIAGGRRRRRVMGGARHAVSHSGIVSRLARLRPAPMMY